MCTVNLKSVVIYIILITSHCSEAIAVDIGCSPITALISFSNSLQFHPSIKRPEVRYHMKKNLIQYNLVGARNMRIMGGLEFWV